MADRIKVLIIDQDENSRNLLISILLKRGYVVHFSNTGSDGIKKTHELLPTIIFCATDLSDIGVPELAVRLSTVSQTASIPIVAISERTNADEMGACLTAGCVEYYGKSGLNFISMVDAIPKIIGAASVRKENGSDEHLLVVFLSAKGGSGTSSLCANIGACLAKNMTPSTVGLADLVLPMGSIDSIVGYAGKFNIVDVARLATKEITPKYLQDNLNVPKNWGFHFLPGTPDPDQSEALNAKQIPDIIKTLTKTYDYTLIDFGRALSKISIPVLKNADAIVIVMGTDLSAVNLTKKLCTFLQSLQIDNQHLFIILNRAVGLEGCSKMEAEQIIGVPIRITIPYMMGNFALANNQNLPIPIKYPTDTATLILNQAALEISSLAIKVNKTKTSS